MENLKVWISLVLVLMGVLFFSSMLQYSKMLIFTWSNQSWFNLELSQESLNILFFSAIVIITLSVFIWAKSYMVSKFKLSLFYLVLFVFVSSMLMLTLSESLFILFIGWEGLGVSSFILIMYYQNWMSAKGALLTLLTNRLGDSILMLLFCYWLSFLLGNMFYYSALLLSLLFLVSCTKSAQWPFVNWLPAAMAAPTPVSALVHSSTLVTAGIWLMIRFIPLLLVSYFMWVMLGVCTLLIASMAALTEKDGKKIVALSTLSQLGMMFMSLSMGNVYICLFHILMHAFSKANLFMVVGELLHKSFSQQDVRHMNLSGLNKFLCLSLTLSVISLTGLLFSSGFYSKEQILIGHYLNLSSIMSWMLMILVLSLTVSYCLKFMFLLSNSPKGHLNLSGFSVYSLLPILIMSILSVLTGWVMSHNFSLYSVLHSSLHGWYWSVLLVGFISFFLSTMMYFLMSTGFSVQSKSIDFMCLKTLPKVKNFSLGLESSISESLFLILGINLSNLWKQSIRLIFILLCFILLLSVL